jgi:hypothetical protein
MRLRRDQLCDRVSKGRVRIDVENREGVTAMLDTAFGEDNTDEMHARGLEQGQTVGVGQVAHINGGYVSHNVVAIINNSDGCQALGAHEKEGIRKRSISAREC